MLHQKSFKKIKKITQDIKSIKIQGATNIAKATIKAVVDYSIDIKPKTSAQFVNDVKEIGDFVSTLRDTEPWARNGVKYLNFILGKNKNKDVSELKNVLRKEGNEFLNIIDSSKKVIAEYGHTLVENNFNIFTHCHSSLVENIVVKANKKARKIKVFNSETRPMFQGRKTSQNLIKNKVNDTMVVDSAAAFLVSEYSGRDLMMDLVLLGCDAIALDGSCVNKVGSFAISLAAFYEKIPVYIAGQVLKLDTEARYEKEIKIERRDPREIWPDAPQGLKIINFAFDTVPDQFITGYITEFGIVQPKDIRKLAKRYYPFIFD